jgi:1,4-dihydroxy-2-naphthoyl-CoA synthase
MAVRFYDVIYRKTDAVAYLTINRPETYNAFTDVTLREMAAALEDASTDREVGLEPHLSQDPQSLLPGRI